VKVRSEQRCFGGVQGYYEHESAIGPMRFSAFLPSESSEKVPAVYFLAGLTCTEETFMAKAGAQRMAAELGLALITCDTSPRQARFPGDDTDWDFGQGAGFYLDATQTPWSAAYRMKTYVAQELKALVEAELPIASDRRGIFGHSMGGHGALTLALSLPGLYQSCSALAPIVAPSQVPWGQKAFKNYLGDSDWAAYDATELVKSRRFPGKLLVDQGTADKFLERELKPELFRAACAEAGQPLELNLREGYDHSYYFIQTFIESHLKHHAEILR
jgi:S-formylglutathione hydrolase